MKKLWLLLPALLIAGLVMMGCDVPEEDNDTTGDVTWTVSADGVGAPGVGGAPSVGVTTTTRITIRFNQNVPTLRAQDVDLAGPVDRVENGFTNSSGTVTILVTPKGSGIVSVTVNKSGIVPGPKTVEVWQQGSQQMISYTAVADGQADTITSTKITFTFTAPFAALGAEDITIGYPATGDGSITKGVLTKVGIDNLVYDLAIIVNTQGKIQVSIPDAIGVDPSVYPVDVYKAVVSGDLYDFTEVDVALACDHSGNNHKGWIEIEDFLTIKYSKPDSLLRITFKLLSNATGGWGEGKFGEIGKSSGGIDFMVPSSTTAGATISVDMSVADLLANVGPDGDGIFVNVWNADPAVEPIVKLVETKSGTRPTNPGYSTVSFDLDGGTYLTAEEIDSVKVENGKALGTKFPTAAPLKADHISQGWFDDETQYTAETVITATVTLKVKWIEGQLPTYTVSFDTAGGTPSTIASISVIEGQPMDSAYPANPRKEGSWFAGWKDSGGTVYTSSTPITADVSLTAQWTASTMPAVTKEGTKPGYKKVDVIYTDGGTAADLATGKGNIEGDSITALKNAPDGSVLLLYLYMPSSITGNRDGYGLGEVGTGGGFSAPNPCPRNDTFFATVALSSISNLASATTYLFVNVYNDAILQRVELWEPDEDYVLPTSHDFTLVLTVNDSYGHQGKLIEDWLFNGTKVEEGDVYEVSFSVESSFALDYVNLSLVDNCSENSFAWAKIGQGAQGLYPIGTTGSPSSVTGTITATGTATNATPEANQLIFETGSETVGENGTTESITLTITNFTIVKQP
jgi:hypothetical protein